MQLGVAPSLISTRSTRSKDQSHSAAADSTAAAASHIVLAVSADDWNTRPVHSDNPAAQMTDQSYNLGTVEDQAVVAEVANPSACRLAEAGPAAVAGNWIVGEQHRHIDRTAIEEAAVAAEVAARRKKVENGD